MRITSFDVDPQGRVNSIIHPDESCETFAYDSFGNLSNYVDRAGRVSCFSYLPTGKLASSSLIADGETNTVSYAYDEQFNTLDIRDALGRRVESYQLDAQDRPVGVTNVEGQVMSVEFGLADYVKSVQRFDGSGVTNTYNVSVRSSTSFTD